MFFLSQCNNKEGGLYGKNSFQIKIYFLLPLSNLKINIIYLFAFVSLLADTEEVIALVFFQGT